MKKLVLIMLCISYYTNAQVPSYVPTNGLVGYWPFNGNATDASGNGNNGTVNVATLTTDRNGASNSAYSFNGLTSYIDCGSNTSLRIIGNLSVSSWFLMDGGSFNPRIVNYGNATNGGYTVFVDGTSNVSRKINATNFNAGGSGTGFCCNNPQNFNLSSLVWHHIVYTSDSNGLAKIYIDGVQISSYQGVPVNNINYSGSFNIGRLNFPSYDTWGGKLDDIGIWNRVLTQQEITNLYNSVSSSECLTMTINTGVLSTTPVTYTSTVNIYPNPTNDQITIDCGNLTTVSGWSIKITNMLGQEVFNQPMNTQQYVVPLNTWSGQGMYFVKIINAQNEVVNIKKIILQ